jgi:K+-sensing histidine kinase KdpD
MLSGDYLCFCRSICNEGVDIVKSAREAVQLQHHQALVLVSSARWTQQCMRDGKLGANANERRIAIEELQDAIDATTAQLEAATGSAPLGKSWAYGAALGAVLAATWLIEVCYLLGAPRTVVGLYIAVVVAIALFIGTGASMVACAAAFVLNDVLFVHPGRFSPTPEQFGAIVVVVLSCLVLQRLTHLWIGRPRKLDFS